MATQILMPKQGNTVESCIILEWKKKEGDSIAKGEVLCEVETDKATFEVESDAEGKVLALFFEAGDDVPVLTPIAVVGESGEDIGGLGPEASAGGAAGGSVSTAPGESAAAGGSATGNAQETAAGGPADATGGLEGSSKPTGGDTGKEKVYISPRARHLAEVKGIDYTTVAGSGPGGRIIERDIRYVLGSREPLSIDSIEEMVRQSAKPTKPAPGTQEKREYAASGAGSEQTAGIEFPGPTTEYAVKGVRKVIAERMYHSLSSTAQLTMSSSADASNILAYRKKLKESPKEFGLQDITINDIVLFVVSRILPRFPEMNAHFLGEKIVEFDRVHLGVAVDTFKGLMVPVIKRADKRSLSNISSEAKRLSTECFESTVAPDDLSGGTFTVSNLGPMGIEHFTPVLNPPEVGILGVCAIGLRAVQKEDEVSHVPHMGLSLTFNHQAVDGAPAARFLKQLTYALSNVDLFLSK